MCGLPVAPSMVSEALVRVSVIAVVIAVGLAIYGALVAIGVDEFVALIVTLVAAMALSMGLRVVAVDRLAD